MWSLMLIMTASFSPAPRDNVKLDDPTIELSIARSGAHVGVFCPTWASYSFHSADSRFYSDISRKKDLIPGISIETDSFNLDDDHLPCISHPIGLEILGKANASECIKKLPNQMKIVLLNTLYVDIESEALAKLITTYRPRHVLFRASQISSDVVKGLARCDLETVEIDDYTNANKDCLHFLKSCTATKISLTYSVLTADEISVLANSRASHLSIRESKLNPPDICKLLCSKSVTYLDLAAVDLSQCIVPNDVVSQSIQSVVLRSTKASPSLLASLLRSPNLTSIDITHLHPDTDNLKLLSACKSLKTITAAGYNDVALAISKIPSAESVDLYICDELCDDSLKQVLLLPNLHSVSAHSRKLSGAFLDDVKCKNLKHVSFAGTAISPATFTKVLSFPSIETISMHYIEFAEPIKLPPLQSSKLREVDLSYCKATDDLAGQVVTISSLESLSVNCPLTGTFLSHLPKDSSLRVLRLEHMSFSDDGSKAFAESIGRCRFLTRFDAYGTNLSLECLQSLAKLSTLSTINLSDFRGRPEDTVSLSASPSLKYLHVGGCKFDKGCVHRFRESNNRAILSGVD